MDPASAVGLASACLSISAKVAVLVRDLKDLRQQYQGAEHSTDLLISKVSLTNTTSRQLAAWLDKPDARSIPEDVRNCLQGSIVICTAVVDGIEETVTKVKNDSAGAFNATARLRYMWNRNSIEGHTKTLDSQIQGLTHLLQLLTLHSIDEMKSKLQNNESQRIFHAASEDASSYRPISLYDGSIRRFDFDREVANSGPYRRALERLLLGDESSVSVERDQNFVTEVSEVTLVDDSPVPARTDIPQADLQGAMNVTLEETMFKMRANLFHLNRELFDWIERGTGDVRLLKHKENRRTRLVMRRDKTLAVIANHYVLPDMKLSINVGSDRSWIWNVSQDISSGEPESQCFAIRFKTSENANLYKEAFMKAQRDNQTLMDDDGIADREESSTLTTA